MNEEEARLHAKGWNDPPVYSFDEMNQATSAAGAAKIPMHKRYKYPAPVASNFPNQQTANYAPGGGMMAPGPAGGPSIQYHGGGVPGNPMGNVMQPQQFQQTHSQMPNYGQQPAPVYSQPKPSYNPQMASQQAYGNQFQQPQPHPHGGYNNPGQQFNNQQANQQQAHQGLQQVHGQGAPVYGQAPPGFQRPRF